jgi:hypothetical protein
MVAASYEIIHVHDLWLLNHAGADGEPLVRVQQMCPDGGHIDVPDLSYGCGAEETDLDLAGAGPDTCIPGPFALPVPRVYFIRDCVIWTKYGLVTVGKYLLKETTFTFPKHLVPEVRFEGEPNQETHATLAFEHAEFARVDNAVSILSGFDENYFHYITMFLTKLDPSVFYAPQWNDRNRLPFVIAPDAIAEYQAESVARLCNIIGAPCVTLEEKAAIRVRNLAIPMISVYGGLFPHPLIKRPLAMLEKSFVPGRIRRRDRKLYISRRDSNNRKLENEAEVEDLVSSSGFEIVCLTGMPLAEQIELFAGATHVIAAHGAGLTNIVFCKPGTNILEIHMLPYISWCYRRLAGVYGLNYGCIWASAIAPTAAIHDATYFLKTRSLATVLTDPGFLAGI